jgi:glutaminyl-peptide cyclotransferase
MVYVRKMRSRKIIILLIIYIYFFTFCSKNGDFQKNKSNNFVEVSKEMDRLNNMELRSEDSNNKNFPKAVTYQVKVIEKYPHDPMAYTQGLFYYNGFLYESTGMSGRSTLRKVNLQTGEIIKSYKVPGAYFAEGIELINDMIYQLTWVSGICFVYNAKTFEPVTEYSYKGQGWGLAKYKDMLIMSDGSNILKFMNPEDFSLIKQVAVFDSIDRVNNINELEYINGEIWANIYQTKKIASICPETGAVNYWIDLSSLYNHLDYDDYPDVLNGIAYDIDNERIFITGKLWKYVFEIEI